MKKKVLSILLCTAIILGSIPFIASAGTGTVYTVNGDKVLAHLSDSDTSVPPTKTSTEDVGTSTSKNFGTKSADGRIWSDKTVYVNSDGTFDVKLSALAQEYESVLASSASSSVGADVVFVLDFTSSMTSNKMKKDDGYDDSMDRLSALADAFNDAADIISKANKKNRMIVYAFHGNDVETGGYCKELMGLAHYESTTGEYFKYNSQKISCPSSYGVTKDGVSFSFSDEGVKKYTTSQYGIANGVKGLIDKITSEKTDSTKKSARKPFVIFMTDGAATTASTNWSNADPTKLTGGVKTSDISKGTAQIAALTTLTAALWKDKLQTAYDEYNTNDARKENASDSLKTYPVEWFNIGVGVTIDKYPNTDATVNPNLIENPVKDEEGTKYNNTSGLDSVRTQIESADTSSLYTKLSLTVTKKWTTEPAEGTTVTVELKRNGSSLSPAKTVTLSADNDWTASFEDLPRKSGSTTYTYTATEGSATSGNGTLVSTIKADYVYADYSDFCNTKEEVGSAFTELAKKIKAASSETQYPVITSTSGEGISGMKFTDVIGEGFELGAPVLTAYKKKSSSSSARVKATVTGTETSTGSGSYTFEGFDTTAQYNSTTKTLTWNIPAQEIGMFTYKNREKLSEANEYVSADPSTLTYTLTYVGDGSKAAYTNAYSGQTPKATCEYTIPGDNYYYFSEPFTYDKTTGDFAGSALNSTYTNNKPEDLAKGDGNNTNTVSNARTYTYNPSGANTADSMCAVSVGLGNNGMVLPALQISKTVDRTVTSNGCDYIYTVTVKNLTDSTNGVDVPKVIINDKLPAGVTFNAGDSGVSNSSGNITINAGTVSKGDTETYKYVVSVPTTATNGTVIKSTDPIISSVDDKSFGNTISSTTNDKLNVTVETINIPVLKKWIGVKTEYQDATVKFAVMNDKTKVDEKSISSTTSWKATFENLPKYEAKKTALKIEVPANATITYTVTETEGLTGYTKSGDGVKDKDGNYVITNTRSTNETFKVPVSKVWVGPKDEYEDTEITVTIKKNNTNAGSVTLNDGNKWTNKFEGLETYYDTTTDDWKKNVYTFSESGYDTTNYDSEIAWVDSSDLSEGITVTNTRKNKGTVNITVNKVWDAPDDDIKDSTVIVYDASDKDEKALDTLTLNDTGKWTATSKDLPEYDSDWKVISYKVKEINYDTTNITPKYEQDKTTGVWTVTNTREGMGSIDIPVSKVWVGPETTHNSVTIQLYTVETVDDKIVNTKVEGKTITLAANDDPSKNWKGSFTGLPKYQRSEAGVWSEIQYTVAETNCPENYSSVPSGNNAGFTVTNTRINDNITVTVKKTWKGLVKDRTEIEVTLKADDASTGETAKLNATNGWTASFTNVPKYNETTWEEVVYTVTEDFTSKDYKPMTQSCAQNDTGTEKTITIVNERNDGDATVDIAVEKKWVGPETDRKAVTVTLLSDGVKTDETLTLDKNTEPSKNWKGTITGLPMYDTSSNDWKVITYTVEETTGVDGYTPSYDTSKINANSLIVTNTKASNDKVWVTVNKVWDAPYDDYKDIKEVKIEIYNAKDANKKKLGEATLEPNTDPAKNWTASVEMDKYDSNWNEIEYAVQEVGYDSEIFTPTYKQDETTGVWTVTNTRKGYGSVDFDVEKVWVGPAGEPVDVTIQLYTYEDDIKEKTPVNGKTITLTTTQLKGAFTGLPKYQRSEAGVWSEIKYTVAETNCPETYSSVVTGDIDKGFTVTNTRINDNITVTVNKIWKGLVKDRTEIEVTLKADDASTGKTAKLNATNGWTASFENVKKYNETTWEEVVYTVTEDFTSDDYKDMTQSCVQNKDDTGKTITIVNERNDGDAKVDIAVEKKWVGPVSERKAVTVYLWSDGEKTDETLVLNSNTEASKNWKGAFKGLPKYDTSSNDWKVITYTVTEAITDKDYPSALYGTDISYDKDTGAATIKNTRKQNDKVTVSFNKEWVGPVDERSDIEVTLLKDSAATTSKKTLTTGHWSDSFEGLDKYDTTNDDWTPFTYTISEDFKNDKYNSSINPGTTANTFVIKNERKSNDYIEIPVTKSWIGPADEQVDVSISLYKDKGTSTEKVTTINPITLTSKSLSEKFTNVPKYDTTNDDWTVITYTVKEDEITNKSFPTEKYKAPAVTGDMTNGFTVVNERNTNDYFDIPVKKVWVGPASEKTEVEVELLSDGNKTGKKLALNSDNKWGADGDVEFESVPKYDTTNPTWTVIAYKVNENTELAKYDVDYDNTDNSFTVTNTRNQNDYFTLTIEKKWVGEPAASVTVNVLQNGKKFKTKTLTSADNWKAEFKDIPVYDSNWALYTYTVSEDTLSGYKQYDITSTDNDYVITNEKAKKVIYDWDKYDPGKDEPKDTTNYYKDDKYPVGDEKIIKTNDTFIDNNGSKWTFKGWDKDPGVMGDTDVLVKAKWEEEKPKHITYDWDEFTPPDIDLPKDPTNYHKGDDYKVDEKKVIKPGDEFIDKDGNKWTFKGWDKEPGKMGENDILVKAIWENEPPKHITYEWDEFTPPIDLPKDPTNYHDGDDYPIDEDKVIKPGDEFIDPEGNKWTFEGWDKEPGKINGEDIEVKAKWKMEAPKHVTYDWGIAKPFEEKLPIDNKDYYKGDPIVPSDKEVPEKLVYDEKGILVEKYTFIEWKGPDTMDEEDVVLVAQWEETPKVPVVYTDEFDKEDNKIPDEFQPLLDTHFRVDPNGGIWDYEEVTYTEKSRHLVSGPIDVEDPTREGYKFVGWDVSEEDGEYIITAQWEKERNCCWVIPVIIGTAGLITGTSIAGGITTAIVGGSIAAIPVAIIGAKHIEKALEEKDEPEEPQEQEDPSEQPDEEIPGTGSQDMEVVVFALVVSMFGAAAVIIMNSRKKKKFISEK